MGESKIVVEVWRDEGPRPEALPPLKRYRWPSMWLGLLGTVFLHGLILQSIPFGTHARPTKPPDVDGGAGATVNKPAGTMAETLILLDLPTVSSNKSSLNEEITSLSASLKTVPLTILSTDPLPAITIPADNSDADASTTADSEDSTLRAAMFGQYTGQIDARIERLWKRPLSSVTPRGAVLSKGASSDEGTVFRCQVKIIQESDGSVLEVQLLQCNGSPEWRQSIVTAIFYASPLPAPPIPAVFTRSLVMSFTGYEYSKGAPRDGYERPTANAALL